MTMLSIFIFRVVISGDATYWNWYKLYNVNGDCSPMDNDHEEIHSRTSIFEITAGIIVLMSNSQFPKAKWHCVPCAIFYTDTHALHRRVPRHVLNVTWSANKQVANIILWCCDCRKSLLGGSKTLLAHELPKNDGPASSPCATGCLSACGLYILHAPRP